MEYKDNPKRQAYNKRYLKQHYKDNKAYYIAKKKRHIQEAREFILSIKLKCLLCDETHPAALDFHHRNGTKKEINVAEAADRGWGKERILNEITKCDIICSNDHRKKHWKETH